MKYKFKRDIYNRGYHIQAAFYMDMLGIDDFRFILCPTNPRSDWTYRCPWTYVVQQPNGGRWYCVG